MKENKSDHALIELNQICVLELYRDSVIDKETFKKLREMLKSPDIENAVVADLIIDEYYKAKDYGRTESKV
jgi:hypothetical protein